MPLRVNKVVAYVTCGKSLLLFRHPKAPEAGIQVPVGTVEADEAPRRAVLRETNEETGLDGLRVKEFLGERDFDMTPFGRDEVHHRYFFHLELLGDAPRTWRHAETAGGTQEPILFDFFWADLPGRIPELIAGQGELLPLVQLVRG